MALPTIRNIHTALPGKKMPALTREPGKG